MIRWHERELLNLPREVWTWKDGRSLRELSRAERREAEETDPSLHPILERYRLELLAGKSAKQIASGGNPGVLVNMRPRRHPKPKRVFVYRPDLLEKNGKK